MKYIEPEHKLTGNEKNGRAGIRIVRWNCVVSQGADELDVVVLRFQRHARRDPATGREMLKKLNINTN